MTAIELSWLTSRSPAVGRPGSRIACVERFGRFVRNRRMIWTYCVLVAQRLGRRTFDQAIDSGPERNHGHLGQQNFPSLRACSGERIECESKKIPPAVFWQFSPNCWEFSINFFTHLLYVSYYTLWQIFTQLVPTLTKLCHTKRDHPANFYISLER